MYAPLLVLLIWSMMNLSTATRGIFVYAALLFMFVAALSVCQNISSLMVDDESVQCTGGIFAMQSCYCIFI